jgi:hypothetical protein
MRGAVHRGRPAPVLLVVLLRVLLLLLLVLLLRLVSRWRLLCLAGVGNGSRGRRRRRRVGRGRRRRHGTGSLAYQGQTSSATVRSDERERVMRVTSFGRASLELVDEALVLVVELVLCARAEQAASDTLKTLGDATRRRRHLAGALEAVGAVLRNVRGGAADTTKNFGRLPRGARSAAVASASHTPSPPVAVRHRPVGALEDAVSHLSAHAARGLIAQGTVDRSKLAELRSVNARPSAATVAARAGAA